MIQILDCTLRDGGYINNWDFGKDIINNITTDLIKANIDIIEVGFIANEVTNENRSVYNDINQIKRIKSNKTMVTMIEYCKYDLDKLPYYNDGLIDGIRYSFRKKDREKALKEAIKIKEKGYKLYLQCVATTDYTKNELISLIKIVNEIKPYAFYIVDTLGIMTLQSIRNTYNMMNYLNKDIKLGFHSHNNLQMSFGNAMEFITTYFDRDIIIDSSIMGMGRGAGNLPTEIICNYLLNFGNYNIDKIIEIADRYIKPLKDKFDWGYLMPYYLSAINKVHPDYINQVNNEDLDVMNKILKTIPKDSRGFFNKKILEDI